MEVEHHLQEIVGMSFTIFCALHDGVFSATHLFRIKSIGTIVLFNSPENCKGNFTLKSNLNKMISCVDGDQHYLVFRFRFQRINYLF